MWIHLDFSGVSLWFLLGLLVSHYWIELTALLVAVVVIGLCCKGVARVLVLASVGAVLAPVIVGLAVYYGS